MASQPKKLLIIDDEEDLCELLKFRLEHYGFEVSVAHNGKEGLEKVLSLKPHCIVLDIRMPYEDGLTFLRQVRGYRNEDLDLERQIRKTPVIVLTGAGESLWPLFQAEGISDYIGKPFDAEDLKNRILKTAGV